MRVGNTGQKHPRRHFRITFHLYRQPAVGAFKGSIGKWRYITESNSKLPVGIRGYTARFRPDRVAVGFRIPDGEHDRDCSGDRITAGIEQNSLVVKKFRRIGRHNCGRAEQDYCGAEA